MKSYIVDVDIRRIAYVLSTPIFQNCSIMVEAVTLYIITSELTEMALPVRKAVTNGFQPF
jgi:hypothetical protein